MLSVCRSSFIRRLSALSVLAFVFFLVGCGSGPQQDASGNTALKVATIPIDAQAQVFYAHEQGFFEDVGLTVEIQSITNGAAIASAVASGELDIGCSNVVSIATAVERGLPFKLVAPSAIYSSDAPTTVMMVAKDSPVESAEDLNGGVVAVNGLKNITEVGARAWIDDNGGDSNSVEFIELPFPQMAAALAEGRADAAVIAEPSLTQAKSDARELGDVYTAIGDEFSISGYFATEKWINENPEVAEQFAEAIKRAAEWANENPEESAKILQEYTEISPETAEEMTRAVNGEALEPDLVQPPLDRAADYEVIKEPLNAGDFVAN